MITLFVLFFLVPSIIYSQNNFANQIIGIPTTYITKPNDTLFRIAREHNVSIRHIKIANAIKGNKIKPGYEIIIPTQRIIPQHIEDGVLINIPELFLYYFEKGEVKLTCPVALGKYNFKTPIGNFKVVSKTLNPTWIPPEWAGLEKPVPPGPKNPLGDRWIQLSRKGYGIHSTNEPHLIGSPVSHGCIRLYPEDAELLYNLVKIGTPVYIIYEPVKVGETDGIYYIEAYPDIYKMGNKNIFEKLKNTTLYYEHIETIEKIIRDARGIPVPITTPTPTVNIIFKDKKLKVATNIIQNKIWCDVFSFVKEIDGEINFIEDKNLFEIYLSGKVILINGQTKEVTSGEYLLGEIDIKKIFGYYFVLIERLSKMLGFNVYVDKNNNVFIY